MNQRERFVIAGILSVVAILVSIDIITDSREGVVLWHVLTEGSMAVYAKAGISGRSELSAFFLEDLLPPAPIENGSVN